MGSITAISGRRARDELARLALAALGLCAGLFVAHAARAQPGPRPADALLRLVPPDAAMVVTLEGLRDQAGLLLKSRLAADLMQLPAVRTWLESEKYLQFERSRTRIETLLGANLTEVRDELFGDAVVLALRLPPEAPADNGRARGILLVRARDLALLKRLIRVVNTIQQDNGELAGIAERQRNGTIYHIRKFAPAANRPSEWYVVYPDGTFAFSNSEALIQSVIDRKNPAPAGKDLAKGGAKIGLGLGDLPKLKAVGSRLPQPAVARLFVDPRHFERSLAAAPRPSKPTDARIMAMLERYLAAVDYAGAALTLSDGAIVVRSVETLNPSLLDPWLRRWAGDVRRLDPELARVPPSALALFSGHVHALALLDALCQIVPDQDQPRLATIETMLTGLLLGQDLRTRVLPLLGPGVLAYFDTRSGAEEQGTLSSSKRSAVGGWPFPLVIVASLGAISEQWPPSLAAIPSTTTALEALDNALRTVLALTAMDEKRAQGRSRITTRDVAGTTVTALDPPVSFAYAVDRVRRRLVLSTSPGAIARYLESSSEPKAGERFRLLTTGAHTEVETYACVDLDAVSNLAGRRRASLLQAWAARQKRPTSDVDRDLSQVLALARLFRAGFITSRFDADATAVHRSVGLIRHDQEQR